MRRHFFSTSILFILTFSNILNAQNNSWIEVNKVQKTIENIIYTFPAEVNIKNRETYIQLCEKSIKENLEILKE